MFNRISIAAATAVSLFVAGQAMASGKNESPAGTTVKEQSNPNAKTRYCARAEMVTGSIRQGRVCKTADEWRAEGIDITKLQQRN